MLLIWLNSVFMEHVFRKTQCFHLIEKNEFSFLLNTTQPLTNPVDHSFVHSMVYKASTSHINQFMEHFVVKYARESSTVKTKVLFRPGIFPHSESFASRQTFKVFTCWELG